MFLTLSSSDSDMLAYIHMLGKEYKGNTAIFGAGCFRDMREDDTMVYLAGHGNRDKYGDKNLTGEMLAADMISFGLPKQVDRIFLVGCGIGEVSSAGEHKTQDEMKQEDSFVLRFAAKLYAQGPQFRKIKIYTLNNLIAEELLSGITVNYFPSRKGFDLQGMNKKQKEKFDAEMKQALDKEPLLSLRKKHEALLNERTNILIEIRELKLHGLTEESPLVKLKRSQFPAQVDIDLCKKKFDEERVKVLLNIHGSLQKETIYSADDIKFALEANPNFEITYEKLELFKLLSSERKMAIRLLNNEIAILKHERHAQLASQPAWLSGITKLFQPKPNVYIDYQIAALEKLRDVIQNKDATENDIKENLEHALQDMRLVDSKDILERLDRVRKALNIPDISEALKKLGERGARWI